MTNRQAHLVILALTGVMLTGCGTPSQQFASGVDAQVNNMKTDPVRLTPLSTYSDDWDDKANSSNGGDFSGAYTRLLIYATDPIDRKSDSDAAKAAQTADLSYTPRDALSRALFGSDYSLNLTANIAVGSYATTVPLATIAHQSDENGENFNRVIHHSKMNFPLFLVKTDGSASIPVVKVTVHGAKKRASHGATAALQAALGVAHATALAPSVITQLTAQTTKDQAQAVDAAISKLFSSGVTEEHWTDRDLRLWRVNTDGKPAGVRIDFRIPLLEKDWNTELRTVGTWTITFDYPRPSIFSDWSVCKQPDKPAGTIAATSIGASPRCKGSLLEAKNGVLDDWASGLVTAGQVLNYNLTDGTNGLGTIRAVLSKSDWYISSQVGLASSNPDTKKAAATSFCRQLKNDITGLGLNGFDANIALWAVTTGMPLPGGDVFKTAPDCEVPTKQQPKI